MSKIDTMWIAGETGQQCHRLNCEVKQNTEMRSPCEVGDRDESTATIEQARPRLQPPSEAKRQARDRASPEAP
jgi:hypothetical protein